MPEPPLRANRLSQSSAGTLNFRVEHVTPGKLKDHGGAAVGRTLRTALPFTVEVKGEPEPRNGYAAACRCRSVYRLTDEAVRQLKRNSLFLDDNRDRSNPCVCACMGRLVE